ncbi:MAG: 50S ribosomal protein L16 [Candidatus Dojkabacteria bacterium]|nr:50S ribosomal protein L16 [Candidatus Dojkabacteria bacterium]
MLQPSQRKYKKEFRGRLKGIDNRGSKLSYGSFGLQALDRGWIKSVEIEAARKAIVNYTKRKAKLWVKIFPFKPYTKKNDEAVRGGGKGEVVGYVSVVRPGRILFEIGGVPENVAKEALRLASAKISVKTRFVSKND